MGKSNHQKQREEQQARREKELEAERDELRTQLEEARQEQASLQEKVESLEVELTMCKAWQAASHQADQATTSCMPLLNAVPSGRGVAQFCLCSEQQMDKTHK